MTDKQGGSILRVRLYRATTTLVALAAFGLRGVASPWAKGQSLSVLYSFTGGSDGSSHNAALIMDKAGNLYGTTEFGGAATCGVAGCGTVFRLDTSGNETVLHGFTGSPGDGANPNAALLMDKAGNLYGTTLYGSTGPCISPGGAAGCGTVFKLDRSGNETVLHTFTGSGGDGANPFAALIMDKVGNLYGTTESGGTGKCLGVAPGCGTVFKLDTSGNETVLHSFAGPAGDGSTPVASLIMDKAGNLYGTTAQGGAFNFGTVFKLDTSGNETILYSFTGGSDGCLPPAALIIDKEGNLYSTTIGGGVCGYGTVFKLVP
jgi:uncharacterized repeat protein (TIGR03803 family)